MIILTQFPSLHIKGELMIEGGTVPAIQITPPQETGLSHIYILNDLNNGSLSLKTNNPYSVKISSFSQEGIITSFPIENIAINDNIVTAKLLKNDSGYIIEDSEKKYYIWIINYSTHQYEISTINLSGDNDCEATKINIIGSGSPIYYYSINGHQNILSRDIILSYNTLVFDKDSHQFVETTIEKVFPSINDSISLIPPILSATSIIIEGDRFLKEWNRYRSLESEIISPISTMVYTEAFQEKKPNNSNIITSDNCEFGGSAPVDISFQSWISDATLHTEWQIASDVNFDDILYRVYQQDFEYKFTDQGTVYVRFIGSNADGTCSSYGNTYTISIDSPDLLIPNAFSPNGDGINDIWKISYKSLLEFKCWIFDRHGHEIYFFSNPEMGWDGKIKGKYAPPGIYYYVIQAIGSDGKSFKKSGDINVITNKSFVQ